MKGTNLLLLNHYQTTPEPEHPLQASMKKPNGKRLITADLMCSRSVYAAGLQENVVSNPPTSDNEAETLPPGHRRHPLRAQMVKYTEWSRASPTILSIVLQDKHFFAIEHGAPDAKTDHYRVLTTLPVN
ncbi:hypothetical protein AVEN_235265-1 [Araneus ventricosus]|uniref:Uncharacterized protein n=1 Tax=Araneus ventricosus TaxID=182803 RepID=A0A4Y2A4U7_ARAVE|nr:hypothetical protein AVEN_235265-1 [Araneus ventricosus]